MQKKRRERDKEGGKTGEGKVIQKNLKGKKRKKEDGNPP